MAPQKWIEPVPETIVQSVSDARIEIDLDNGGRIASLAVGGHELLVAPTADRLQWGLYPMAPYAGRVREGQFEYAGRPHRLPTTAGDHAIHGTVLDRPWVRENDATFVCDLGENWPFAGFTRQSIRLKEDELLMRLEVHTTGESMPASCGWHPWFVREINGSAALLDFHPGYMLVREGEVSTRTRVEPPPGPWDDCFGDVREAPAIRWPDIVTLSIESTCPYWVVYTEPEHALCVEPQTAPPDALNIDPSIVTPDRPLIAEMALRWSLDSGSGVKNTPCRG